MGQMLGMGDIVGLVEAAQSVMDEDEARRQAGAGSPRGNLISTISASSLVR